MTNLPDKTPASEILIYQTEDGRTRIQVRLEDEDEGELAPGATIRKFRIVQTEGSRRVSREVDFYNLDMIISLGYRVKSHVATRFRQWATQRLREYIIKGFTLDDERLKQAGGGNYFDLREGCVVIGSLFNEPMRVETVRAGGLSAGGDAQAGMTRPMQVREDEAPYGERTSNEETGGQPLQPFHQQCSERTR